MLNKLVSRRLMLVMIVLIFMADTSLPVMAVTPSAYSVRAMIPDNQLDNRLTYFDLMVSPGDSQILQVTITNSEEQEVEAHVDLCPASTAQNGLIVYTEPEPRDESLTLAVTDFSTVLTPKLHIPAGETAIAEIQLDVPEQAFEGVVLGGISVTTDYTEEQPGNTQQEGFQIENRYAYVIGLKLQENPENTDAVPDFHLKGITPGLVNYRQALLVNLQQSEPFIANHLEISAQVTKLDDLDFIRQLELSNAQMAPNSNGDFAIDWSAPINPGTYRLLMRVEREGDIWEWDEEFSISEDTAAQLNEQSVVNQSVARAAVPVWIIILLAVLLIFVILLLHRKKKKNTAPPHMNHP